MSECLTRLVCSGCGAEAAPDEAFPFRCPNATTGDDVDHVLRRELVVDRAAGACNWKEVFASDEQNPFVRYRRLFHSYGVALSRGMSDQAIVDLVRRLDEDVASVAGTGFRETSLRSFDALNQAVGRSSGRLLVKDETTNVSGSHKARHLFGILLWLRLAAGPGLSGPGGGTPRLAIASCGNAALAAAVVARAAACQLDVFIPPDAHPAVMRELMDLDAKLAVCRRSPGVAGDPCISRFHDDLADGALPFAVQGNENGLTLEGGMTLGYEIVSALMRDGAGLDRLFIQVGGGALASATARALREAVDLGVLGSMPKIHAVQTKGGYPLRRAWELVVRHAFGGVAPLEPESDEQVAERLTSEGMRDVRRDALRYATSHRSEFMWPWESPPHSAAHGILDDETYDWVGVVEAMLETGGYPLVVQESTVLEANEIGKRATGIAVEHTGTAGLAGLMRLQRTGVVKDHERLGVLFTGRER
jgi:threonine synthase